MTAIHQMMSQRKRFQPRLPQPRRPLLRKTLATMTAIAIAKLRS
jgi:hypothetical protein